MTPISVIITCYNLEAYVGAAIESVLAQRFDGEIEILVVDDCSTDGSAEIVQRYKEVRYVRTAGNSGVLLATITGMEAAAGDLLFFLDGDDIWDADKLARIVPRFAENDRLGFVTHDLVYIDHDGVNLSKPSRPHAAFASLSPGQVGEAVREGILTLSDFVWLGSAMAVRRSLVDLPGFCSWARSLPDPRNTYQDWPLAYWIAARPDVRLDYVPAKLFRYRLHGLNHSGDASSAEKALRNIRRTYNTTVAMHDIAVRSALPAPIRNLARQQRSFYAYLIALYEGHRLAAAGGFARAFSYLARRPRAELAKELVRFLAIELLGPAAFIRLMARR